MAKVYFASPMEGIDFATVKSRYLHLEKQLKRNGHELANPISFYEEEIPTVQSLPRSEKSKYIVSRDIERLKIADIILIDLSMGGHKYIGCICEMVYAYTLGKPVIAFVGDSKYEAHPWIVYHCQAFYNKLEDALSALNSRESGT